MTYFFFYIPLGTEDPPRRFPFVTVTLALLLVVVHGLLHYSPAGRATLFHWVLSTADPSFSQAFTACFVHGDLFHLVGNLTYLITFGPALEERLGRPLFLAFYFLGGVVSMLIQVRMIHWLQPEAPPISILGASGAISALLGLFLVRCWFLRVRVGHATMALLQGYSKAGITPVPAYVAVGAWTLLQTIYSLLNYDNQGGTAYWAHLAGLLFGFSGGFALQLWRAGYRERFLIRARRYMRAGQFFGALGDLESYREHQGETYEGRMDEGRCLRLLDRPADAEAAYERAFALCIESTTWTGALEVVEETGRMNPPALLDPKGTARLARHLQKNGRALEAAECLERSGDSEANPEPAGRYLETAAHLFRAKVGDLERAASLYHRAAERLERGPEPPLEKIASLRKQRDSCLDVLEKRSASASRVA